MPDQIRVQGLAEFSRGLRKISADAPKGLRIALNASADSLIRKTLPLIPRRTGAASKSLRAQSTRTSVRIAVGGNRARYYPWLDFGGRTGRHRSVRRPFLKEGRYLYPTLGRMGGEIAEELDQALRDVARNAGLEVD